jgi:hypothetical protein
LNILEVEAAERHPSGGHPAHGAPLVDPVILKRTGATLKYHFLRLSIDRLRPRAVVTQPQRMAVDTVLVPVKQAAVLEPSMNMVVIGFVVLHRKCQQRMLADNAIFHVTFEVVREGLLAQVDHVCTLEDGVILPQPKKSEPWL